MNGAANRAGAGATDRLVLGAALLASLVIVWLATRQPVIVAAFAAGIVGLGAAVWVLRPRQQARETEYALPDWSVTVAAIDRGDCGVAITDRAGRLVCANPIYEQWFTAQHAPPRLPVDNASLERLAKAARAGWRDGGGAADLIEAGHQRWKASAQRAGRGDDYLVWTFTPLTPPDLVSEMIPHFEGKLGRALASAGLTLAIVDPDGKLRAASPGFAARATGDAAAILTGKDFASLMLQDEGDRISWARDGKRGAPLTLFYLPVADPDAHGAPDYDQIPSLILVADSGAGIGGGGGESSAAVPHLEALLAQLPLDRKSVV